MEKLIDELKINCISCEKDIYVTKDTHNCPYCKYEFKEDMLAILFANINSLKNNEQLNIPEVTALVKPYVDTSSVDIQCGSCGNYVSISSTAYICPFCKGSFTPDSFGAVLDFYNKGGSIRRLTPIPSKSKAVGDFFMELSLFLNALGNLGCLLSVFIPFLIFLYVGFFT